ncbi:TPA: nucleotidyltransferase domain-containing protein [Candidatus Poribacteria bacterium]|nr:nucleotidyltransferase domain-containing protein [Candidatus Poribacteria bacterium]
MAKVNDLAIKLTKKFLKVLQEQGIKVESAYIFGSYAKGKEHKWSDIDIAIISSDFSSDRCEESARLMKLSCKIDSRIEPVPFRPEMFVDEDPLVYEIKKTGYMIA